MADNKIIGIDVGTTSVKAAILDRTGKVHQKFSETYPTSRPKANIVEQDPDDWVRLIGKALAGFGGGDAAAIGLCSQVNTHVFVGADGNPLMPAILWQDGRASAEAAALDAQVTDAQKVKWWGAPMPIDASHALARMKWVASHRPDIWDQTRWVMLPKDYCLFKLTGIVATDPLSNIGLVSNEGAYIDEVLDLVPGAADRMAPLVDLTESVGKVVDGPFQGTKVVCGTMDAWAGLVGTGGARENSTVYLSGTSEILGISSHMVNATPGVIVFPQNTGIRLHAAPTQSGGEAKRWFAHSVGLTLDAMSELVANTPRSTATPLFLPQLEGERAPLWDVDLRAAFLGVSRKTTRPDFARAVYEGVALSARHALETVQASSGVTNDQITCGGGGFQSTAWSQIRADILGVELQTLATNEPGVLGAAAFAALAAGFYENLEAACEVLAIPNATFVPDGRAHARYDTLFAIYKEAISANADITKQLTVVSELDRSE